MARKKKSKKDLRNIACTHLQQLNQISNSGLPLCYCEKRDFNISPYNEVCQICSIYNPNTSGITHENIYKADNANNFDYDLENIDITDRDFLDEEIDYDDLDDEFDTLSDDETDLVIGHEKDEDEDLDYHDEREEDLGKHHGLDDEDEKLDEELEELESDLEKDLKKGESKDTYDFEKEAIKKIKYFGKGDDKKEICPFCKKTKVSVLRHITRCKKTPDEVKDAYREWRKKNK